MKRFLILALLALTAPAYGKATVTLKADPPNPTAGTGITLTATMLGYQETPGTPVLLTGEVEWGSPNVRETMAYSCTVTPQTGAHQDVVQPRLTIHVPPTWTKLTEPIFTGFVYPSSSFDAGTLTVQADSLPADTPGTVSLQLGIPKP